MAEIELPVVITAIANSDLEGFVAGTLFTQGWSVIYRALDVTTLLDFITCNRDQAKRAIVIYSPDLPKLTLALVESILKDVRQVIGLSSETKDVEKYPSMNEIPVDATALVSLIRGFVRAPMIRTAPVLLSTKKKACILALGSASSAAGCSTIAINLAMELSVMEKDVLLLDGDVRRPSIAALLELRKFDGQNLWHLIASHLSAGEITREQISDLDSQMVRAESEFDFIIIDVGLLEELADSLTDRRWTSSVIHWSCDNADQLWMIGMADCLGTFRISNFVRKFSKVSIRARISIVLNAKVTSRKNGVQESQFLSAIASLHPERIYTLPRDSRAIAKAQSEHATLIEMDDRSALRKAIEKIAVEVAG